MISSFSKGMISLFRPRDPLYIPSEDEMEQEVWQAVGDALRSAMSDYEQTKEYKTAVRIAQQK